MFEVINLKKLRRHRIFRIATLFSLPLIFSAVIAGWIILAALEGKSMVRHWRDKKQQEESDETYF